MHESSLATTRGKQKDHSPPKRGSMGTGRHLKELPVCRNYPMALVQELLQELPVRNYLYRVIANLRRTDLGLICPPKHTKEINVT